MSVTKKHHFIPAFYLKEFVNEKGGFYIYDVKRASFKQNGKLFSPDSHFFELFANTAKFGVDTTDFVESGFSKWDNQVASIYKKLRVAESGSSYDLTPEDWTLLQFFVNILHWRNPANESRIKEFVSNATSMSEFMFKIIKSNSGERASEIEEADFLSRLKGKEDFYKFIRLQLPAITFPEVFGKKDEDFAHIINVPKSTPFLVSDYPMIYRKLDNSTLHTDEFIFPLTPTQLLFKSRLNKVVISTHTKILIDTLLLMQAKNYVACIDKRYPLFLREYYEQKFSSVDQLRELIFQNYILEG